MSMESETRQAHGTCRDREQTLGTRSGTRVKLMAHQAVKCHVQKNQLDPRR